jgi:hypothetical protein
MDVSVGDDPDLSEVVPFVPFVHEIPRNLTR